MAQPDSSEFGHGKECRSELVVACGYASVIFELIEDALDQVALPVEPRRKADRVFLLSLGWDVGPTTLLRDQGAQPVCVVSALRAPSAPRKVLHQFLQARNDATFGVQNCLRSNAVRSQSGWLRHSHHFSDATHHRTRPSCPSRVSV